MASIVWTPPPSATHRHQSGSEHRRRSRPLPLRIRTFSVAGLPSPGMDENRDGVHARNKSTSTTLDIVAQFSPSIRPRMLVNTDAMSTEPISPHQVRGEDMSPKTVAVPELSPPLTPSSERADSMEILDRALPAVMTYDFTKIDYELERAKVLGTGLWSTVYLAEAYPVKTSKNDPCTPPATPKKSRKSSAPSRFAVKKALRTDAKEVFAQEARILSRLQNRPGAEQFLVPFYGYDSRNDALIFEAVLGGSLENLVGRLKQMTEVARHVELISIFPGIADDLVSGLAFLHSHGVIHADIKSANVLLDIFETFPDNDSNGSMASPNTSRRPTIRARFIDLSAAFMPAEGDSHNNAGGTWAFLAPEQLKIFDPELSTPSQASDVWSLGITLLNVLVGGNPYEPAAGDNMFMLREAIKAGDPLGFARMEPVWQKRLAACQDFVDCCRLALNKNRENRVTASGWAEWLEDRRQGF